MLRRSFVPLRFWRVDFYCSRDEHSFYFRASGFPSLLQKLFVWISAIPCWSFVLCLASYIFVLFIVVRVFVWCRCANSFLFVVGIGPFDWLFAFSLALWPLHASLQSHAWGGPRKSLLGHRGFIKLISVMMTTRSGSSIQVSEIIRTFLWCNRISKVADVASSVPQLVCIIKAALDDYSCLSLEPFKLNGSPVMGSLTPPYKWPEVVSNYAFLIRFWRWFWVTAQEL